MLDAEEGRRARTVLIVEDDPAVRSLVSTALGADGYRVMQAVTGEEAIRRAASGSPDVLLLDLGLPDMDGASVLERVRTWSGAPVIVISARTGDSDKIAALDAGADDYLTKPFSVEELLARVRASLRRVDRDLAQASSGAQEASTFSNGDLSIDYAAKTVERAGTELHLTPIEYKLLCLLSKNCGKVLTHGYLTKSIWGTSWDSDIVSLRVFMATLRKKIEPDPSRPRYIQTRIGVGYRMVRVD